MLHRERKPEKNEAIGSCIRTLSLCMNNVGCLLHERGDFDNAIDMYQGAVMAIMDVISPDELTTKFNSETYFASRLETGRKKLEEKANVWNKEFCDKAKKEEQSYDYSQPFHAETTCIPPNHSSDHCCLAMYLFNVGLAFYKQGAAVEKATQLFEMSMNAVTQAGKDFDRIDSILVYLASLNRIAQINQDSNGIIPEKAVRELWHAFDICEKLFDVLQMNSTVSVVANSDQSKLRLLAANIMTDLFMVMYSIGRHYEENGTVEEPLMLYSRILEIWLKPSFTVQNKQMSTLLSYVLYRVGSLYYRKGTFAKGKEVFKYSVSLRIGVVGEKQPEIAALLCDIGLTQFEAGDFAGAMESFQASLHIRQECFGNEDRCVAETHYRIGVIYQSRGQHCDALNAFRESLRIEKLVLGAGHPDVAVTLTNMGQTYYFCGQFDWALDAYKEAAAIIRTSIGENHPSLPEILDSIGAVHLSKGSHDEAAASFEESRRASERSGSFLASVENNVGSDCSEYVHYLKAASDNVGNAGAAAA